MKHFISIASLMFSLLAQGADKVTVTVSNSLGFARASEVVEVPVGTLSKKLAGATQYVVTDADGNEVASQATANGMLIFQASVAAKGKSVYYVKAGEPKQYDKRATGRLFVERGDEFGWENDRVAYRVYGHGGAVGYDLFNKSTTELMLDHWYASEQNQEMRSVSQQLRERGFADLADQVYNAYCYHIDHGKGMDCYTVGPTLGGGADALVGGDGTLCMPKCYKQYEILENGPLRFSARLTYPEVDYDGATVVETRVITLDAGSHFCKAEVSFAGLNDAAPIASGVVVHKDNPSAYVLNKTAGYIGYEDLGDASVYNAKYRDDLAKQMGRIYVGTVYPGNVDKMEYQQRENGIATGHVLGIATMTAGSSFTYYFGTGWSGNPNTGFNTLTDWEAHLAKVAQQVKTPLKVSCK